MKKKLFIVFFILISMTALLSSIVYGIYRTSFSIGDNSTTISIEAISGLINKNSFYDELKLAADKDNINIYKIDYPDTKNAKSKVVVYAYINDTNTFYEKLYLKTGRYLDKEDNDNLYMSSKKSDDVNCIGVIKWFDGSTELEIRPLTASRNDLINGNYTIGTNNSSKVNNFTHQLNQNNYFNIKLSRDTDRITMIDSIIAKYLLIIIFAFVMLAILISCFIIILYDIVLQFKEFAIKKINGYTNKTLIHKMYKDITKNYLISFLLSFLLITIVLFFYNRWSYYLSFILIITTLSILTFIVIFIFSVIASNLLVRKINLSNMLKNKKPRKLIKLLNSASKVLFSVCSIVVLSLLLQNLFSIYNQTQDLKKWDFTRNYSFLRLTINDPNDENEYLEFHQKTKKFFNLTNKDGGILMAPSDGLLNKDIRKNYPNYPDWHEEINSVSINNNYLKKNPIYDINNNRVLFNDENEKVYNILVPQKYYGDNQNIIEFYNNHKDFLLRHFEQDKPEDVIAKIVFVKDNQNYFSMNPNCGVNEGFIYTDPIAITFNSTTTSEDMSSFSCTQGYYYPKIDDANNPINSLATPLKQSGLESNLITAPSLYSYVSSQFFYTYTVSALYTILALISLSIFILIIMISIINYMDQMKTILAVEKIHGFSFISRHKLVYLKSIILWGLFFSISALFFSSYYAQFITLGLAVIDIIIKTIVIKIKELKNTKDTLKGE